MVENMNRRDIIRSKTFLDQDCFRCLSHQYKVIPIAKLCDGVFDCSDLSDECICKNETSRPKLCHLAVFEATEDENEDVSRSFLCDSGNNNTRVKAEQICDDRFDCSNKVDEFNCKISDQPARDYKCSNEYRYATRCDGKPECFYDVYAEECEECGDTPRLCGSINRINYTDWCGRELQQISDICNGLNDCTEKQDELDCTNRTHFYCHEDPTSYVLVKKVCDQKADCADESDELCEESFRCLKTGTSESEILYVHKDKICDGSPDCPGGIDECQHSCIRSSFSSTSSLIKNKAVLGGLYTISSVALCGNIIVFIMIVRVMLCPRRGKSLGMLPKDKRDKRIINKVLILSLAISDVLVVIYTMAICIQSSLTEGEYCLVDDGWRSGSSCTVLGVLLLIGSEQSVFTLMIIAGFRLYTIWRPYRSVSVKKFSILLGLTWIISISLGVIPLIPYLEDTFTTSIWYKENRLFSTIEQKDVTNFTYWLLLMHTFSNKSNSDIGSWSTLEKLIGEMKPNSTASRRFGFYSSHTVCIPELFPDSANIDSWWYSLLLIIINFLGFLVIAFGYFLIYRRATKTNQARDLKMKSKLSSKMQKRLIRIITTDFLCWMPVCIMAFLRLSGVEIPDDLRLVVGMIIIPINSALNPIIYSGLLSVIVKKCKQFYKIVCVPCIEPVRRHIRARRAGDIELNRRDEDEVQQPAQRVIEETAEPDEIYDSDPAAGEGQVAKRETTSV